MSEQQDTAPTIPFGTPALYEVQAAELKRELRSGAKIAKVGLAAPSGHRFWAEMYVPKDGRWPQLGREILIVTPPEQEGWMPEAKRPVDTTRGADEAARQAMIVAQSARTAALEELRAAAEILPKRGRGDLPTSLGDIREQVDARVRDITAQALELGAGAREAFRGRS